MSTTIVSLRTKMGTTQYYVSTMKAGELIRSVGFAHELPEWEDMDVDERMQRELNLQRVIKEIVPYLQKDPDRFFGALIVDIYRGWDRLAFEPLKDVARVPKAYEQALATSAELGFLHLAGNERLIALDGQHRLKALQVAIKGDPDEDIKPCQELLDDDITVIFIPHGTSNQKIRAIFNKVNRYAKATSRGDNIITSEDDTFAILARRLIKPGEPLPEELVNWKSNTLSPRSTKFTTISAVYESIRTFLADERIDTKRRPSEEALDKHYDMVRPVWQAVLEGIEVYAEMLENRGIIPEMREKSLLFKPAGQMAMFAGLKLAIDDEELGIEEAAARLNQIDWDLDADHWKSVIMKPGGTISVSVDARRLSARLIAWMIRGRKLSTAFVDELKASIARVKEVSVDDVQLPDPVPTAR